MGRSRSVKSKLLYASIVIAGAFVVVTVVGWLLDKRETEIATQLRDDLVPRLEFGPRLKLAYRGLFRVFQDAAAAEDPDLLAAAGPARDALDALVEDNASLLSTDELSELKGAIDQYYKAAHRVTRAMIEHQVGEHVVRPIEEMRRRQQRLAKLVDKHSEIDRDQIVSAFRDAERSRKVGMVLRLATTGACLALAIIILAWLSRHLVSRLDLLVEGLERFGKGRLDLSIPVEGGDEIAAVAKQANQMAGSLAELLARHERNEWLASGQNQVGQELRGELSREQAAARVLRILCRYTGAAAGTFYYLADEELTLLAAHGTADGMQVRPTFKPGQAIVGRAFSDRETVQLEDLPPGYFDIVSSLGTAQPAHLLVTPLVRHDAAYGVIELAFLHPPHPQSAELLKVLFEEIIISMEVATARARVDALLEETREQATLLASQEEELRVHNAQLQEQQEELRATNEELEEQREILRERNDDLTQAHSALEQKARELMEVSGYKSRFLAHMSHELRTPLNSMLLLSGILVDDERDRLTETQLEYCQTIHSAGESLLALINDLLDLAKIESGRAELSIGSVRLTSVCDHVEAVCAPIAAQVGTAFRVQVEDGTPEFLETDERRLGQVLLNLAGNAAKFTRDGTVTLCLQPTANDSRVRFSVADDGPGIPPEDLARVFDAFDQGSGAQRSGGTGLGLAIASELVTHMGGKLEVESTFGEGSTFFFSLPTRLSAGEGADAAGPEVVHPERPYILVIDDDPALAHAVRRTAEGLGFDVLGVTEGEAGYRQAFEVPPAGIVLDLLLPDAHGFDVLRRLRADERTAEIPVHVVSAVEEDAKRPAEGLVGYSHKPLTPAELARVVERLRDSTPHQPIVVFEPDEPVADNLEAALASEGWTVQRTRAVEEAIQYVRERHARAVVVGLGPGGDGAIEVLRRVRARSDGGDGSGAHLIVYCDGETPPELMHVAQRFADLVLIKQGRYADRVREELKLFFMHLHDRGDRTPPPAEHGSRSRVRLEGKKVLLVDDDVRTVYALTALLRGRGAVVFTAENGQRALEIMDEHPEVDCVLMDLMMPEMDGYEALQRMRAQKRFRMLPVVILTASATPEDRERCLQAGATDYLTKPVDYSHLLVVVKQHAQPSAAHA